MLSVISGKINSLNKQMKGLPELSEAFIVAVVISIVLAMIFIVFNHRKKPDDADVTQDELWHVVKDCSDGTSVVVSDRDYSKFAIEDKISRKRLTPVLSCTRSSIFDADYSNGVAICKGAFGITDTRHFPPKYMPLKGFKFLAINKTGTIIFGLCNWELSLISTNNFKEFILPCQKITNAKFCSNDTILARGFNQVLEKITIVSIKEDDIVCKYENLQSGVRRFAVDKEKTLFATTNGMEVLLYDTTNFYVLESYKSEGGDMIEFTGNSTIRAQTRKGKKCWYEIQNYEELRKVLFCLLKAREFCQESVFWKEKMPLDILKVILSFARIPFVIPKKN